MAQIRAQINSIDQRVNRLTDKLIELDTSSKRLSDEVGRLELERALINSKIARHELKLEEAGQNLAQNEVRRDQLLQDAEVQRKRIGVRLRQLYKRGTLGHSQILLKQSRLSELINAYHYARVLTRRDHQALQEFQVTLENLEAVRIELTRIQETAAQARAELDQQKKAMQSVLKKRARRLEQIRKESETKKELLQDLELEKDEMLVMIQRLLDQDADPLKLQVPITRYKGRLNWPVKGRMLHKFGVYRDPEFKTKQRRNGIDLRLEAGKPVKSVYSGRVVYADWFKSYGNVVVIDHGSKIISFYAHCQELKVARGDFVEREQVIALSGDTGSLEGAKLHFEIRERTEPVDPLSWLKQR